MSLTGSEVVEALKSLPDNLKELYVNIADKFPSGAITGAAANTADKAG